MHAMKAILWLALLAILGFTACNYTDGPCYRREDIEGNGSNGAGGGPIVPGQGGYGDVPPEPQDATDPPPVDCNLEEQPDKGDDKGDDSSSCGDIDVGTVSKGETYAYCSGPCEAKCLAVGMGSFAPAAFKFTTTVTDNGEGKAGGWQVATSSLDFVRWTSLIPEYWSCTVSVGMPLRTEVHGTISAQTAATITAGVATLASTNVRKSNPDLPPGIFCSKFKAEMASIFGATPLTSYGAKMMVP